MLIDMGIMVVKILVVIVGLLLSVAYVTLAERKVSGFIQERYGPNRVGRWGLLQPFADGLKLFLKEDIIPSKANVFIFILAPALVLAPALLAFAVVPFGTGFEIFGRYVSMQIVDVNIGVLYVFALTSVSVYGIMLGGWGSNNKYALLGGIRSSAQMLSYEISLGLSIVGILLIAGSLRMSEIVASQQGMWNVFRQPLGFMIFTISMYAETNRLPFDLAECEQELVAGYHTEYSAFKHAMYMMGEYASLITASAMIVTLFFGGWDMPFVDEKSLGTLGAFISFAAFTGKTAFFIFLAQWVRWTLPRFRYDQLMNLGWKILLPLALLNVILTAAWMTFV